MTRVILGLGSNLGDRRRYLREAVDSLGRVVDVSPVYETEPVGGPAQATFLNIVVVLDRESAPRALLGVCHRLESAAGRVRSERFGPRTLDVDVLWIDGVTLSEPDLQVPHPRMRSRRFVMAPLRDVAPDLVPDDWEEHVQGRAKLLGPLVPACVTAITGRQRKQERRTRRDPRDV